MCFIALTTARVTPFLVPRIKQHNLSAFMHRTNNRRTAIAHRLQQGMSRTLRGSLHLPVCMVPPKSICLSVLVARRANTPIRVAHRVTTTQLCLVKSPSLHLAGRANQHKRCCDRSPAKHQQAQRRRRRSSATSATDGEIRRLQKKRSKEGRGDALCHT